MSKTLKHSNEKKFILHFDYCWQSLLSIIVVSHPPLTLTLTMTLTHQHYVELLTLLIATLLVILITSDYK